MTPIPPRSACGTALAFLDVHFPLLRIVCDHGFQRSLPPHVSDRAVSVLGAEAQPLDEPLDASGHRCRPKDAAEYISSKQQRVQALAAAPSSLLMLSTETESSAGVLYLNVGLSNGRGTLNTFALHSPGSFVKPSQAALTSSACLIPHHHHRRRRVMNRTSRTTCSVPELSAAHSSLSAGSMKLRHTSGTVMNRGACPGCITT